MKAPTQAILFMLAIGATASPIKSHGEVAKRQISWSSIFPSFSLPSSFGGGTGSTQTTSSTPSASTTPKASSTSVASITPSSPTVPNTGGSIGSSTGNTTANDVTDNAGYKDITFIYARGTGETGNMGYTVGPGVASALQKLHSSVAIQGANYPADTAGNINQGGSGGPNMASLFAQAMKQCPNTKVALGGYSQGAMVVHNALSNGVDGQQVSSAVVFGDPMAGQSFSGVKQVKSFCGSQDTLCSGAGRTTGTGGHLDYGANTQEAAQFIVTAAGY